MLPPVTLDALNDMWAQDAIIDETEPARTLAKIPILHAKYLRILNHHNLVVKKLHFDYITLRDIKRQYYRGDLNNPEDLKKYGWEPFLDYVSKDSIPYKLESDKDLTNILIKKVMHEEIVGAVTAIMKELHSRTFQIKAIIDWTKFTAGQ